MATVIYHYTGTGNSLWLAKLLAENMPDARVASMAEPVDRQRPADGEVIGLVFPVHMWGVPRAVVNFAKGLSGERLPGYYFAVAAHAGQVSNTLVELKNILKDRGIELCCGFEVEMPSNYIPWGSAAPRGEQEALFASARAKTARIAEQVAKRALGPIEKGPLWQRIIFTAVHKASFGRVQGLDRNFWVDGNCNRCGVCTRVCPTGNITLLDGGPSWHHGCQQCLACIQWCPKKAIQYGKKTPAYERYHHPEIKLGEVVKR